MSNANAHNEEDQTPGWLQHVLLFIATYIRQLFTHQAEQTKTQRRTGIRSDWQDFIPELRQCEQLNSAIIAEGARQILAGETLNLNASVLLDLDAPWLPPRTAQQMHLRMLGLSRFHADPEFFIRRHAGRILRRAARAATTIVQQQSNPDFPAASAPPRATTTTIRVRNIRPAPAAAATTTLTTARPGMRVRAPPWRLRLPVSDCRLPRMRSFRERLRMPFRGRAELPKVYPQEPVAVAFTRQIGVTTNLWKVLPIGRHVLCDSFDAGPAR